MSQPGRPLFASPCANTKKSRLNAKVQQRHLSRDLNAHLPVPPARLNSALAQGNQEEKGGLTALEQRGEVMLGITQGCTHT